MRVWMIGALALAAANAQAADPAAYVAQITADCTPAVTTQLRNCSVSHTYTCNDGRLIAIGLTDGQYVSANLATGDFAPISWVGLDGFGHTEVTSAQQWFSFNTLRTQGRSDQQARVKVKVDYFEGEIDETVEAALDGQRVEVGGRPFLTGQAVFRQMMPQPYGVFEARYDLFVSETLPFMALSISSMNFAGQTDRFESGLMAVILPGEAGFLDNRGQYDCDANGVTQ